MMDCSDFDDFFQKKIRLIHFDKLVELSCMELKWKSSGHLVAPKITYKGLNQGSAPGRASPAAKYWLQTGPWA